MIKHYDYDAEEFTVTTADGYNLTIYYVYSSKYVNNSLTPIILVPGMYDTSDSFCIHSYSLGKYKTIVLNSVNRFTSLSLSIKPFEILSNS